MYCWSSYFDPSTGYIIGYNWLEQDSDSSGNSFTYTENLYVTATSYLLATAAAPPGPGLSSLLYPLIAFAAILLIRSEEHTSELQSHLNLVCRLLLEKKKKIISILKELRCTL